MSDLWFRPDIWYILPNKNIDTAGYPINSQIQLTLNKNVRETE